MTLYRLAEMISLCFHDLSTLQIIFWN